ncbi:MAG: hypothetical protein ATN35_02175 [Epulopiscium sp. Nele67-Bin004]|nr:MAG: hypothetical protein ATN35_02175 [Epulopiscium sp. Nele67-Bin004]
MDNDETKKVMYNNKNYAMDDDNQLWLDRDYRIQYTDVTPEIITWLGFSSSVLTIQLTNYNGRVLTQDPIITIHSLSGAELANITIDKFLLTSEEITINVAEINLATNAVKILL